MIKKKVCLASAITLLVGCSTAAAQVDVPFQITASNGTLDRFPVFPDDVGGPGIVHDIDVGTATIDGQSLNYTGAASIRVLDVPDATFTVPFDSDMPFTFDFGGGNTFQMHYGRADFGAPDTGYATVSPGDGAGLFDVVFLATFNYVPGSGTGDYANVIGGEIFMTAVMDEVDLTVSDIPYTWSSDVGYLTVVPEPTSVVLGSLGIAGLWGIRRRSRA